MIIERRAFRHRFSGNAMPPVYLIYPVDNLLNYWGVNKFFGEILITLRLDVDDYYFEDGGDGELPVVG